MNCKKARFYFPLLAGQELKGWQAKRVANHLRCCPDCQASFEKTRKLTALLGLKRHEQPDEFFFRTFLSNFHQRLYTDLLPRHTFWGGFRESLGRFSRPAWVTGAALSFAAALVVLLGHFSFQGEKGGRLPVRVASTRLSQPIVLASAQQPSSGQQPVWSDVVVKNGSAQKTIYVLDRIKENSRANESIVLSF